MYIDGTVQSTTDSTASSTMNTGTGVFWINDNGDANSQSYIDRAAVFSEALSASQVSDASNCRIDGEDL